MTAAAHGGTGGRGGRGDRGDQERSRVSVREEAGHRPKESTAEEGDQWSPSRADRALPPVCRYGDGGSCGSCCGGGTHWGSRTCGRATGHGYDPCRVPRAPYVRQVSGPARGDGCGHGSATGTAGGTAVPVVMPSAAVRRRPRHRSRHHRRPAPHTAGPLRPRRPALPSGAAFSARSGRRPPGPGGPPARRPVLPLPSRADLSPRSWSVRPERPPRSRPPPRSPLRSLPRSPSRCRGPAIRSGRGPGPMERMPGAEPFVRIRVDLYATSSFTVVSTG